LENSKKSKRVRDERSVPRRLTWTEYSRREPLNIVIERLVKQRMRGRGTK
jgi:ribosomal protein L24E